MTQTSGWAGTTTSLSGIRPTPCSAVRPQMWFCVRFYGRLPRHVNCRAPCWSPSKTQKPHQHLTPRWQQNIRSSVTTLLTSNRTQNPEWHATVLAKLIHHSTGINPQLSKLIIDVRWQMEWKTHQIPRSNLLYHHCPHPRPKTEQAVPQKP